MNGKNTLNKQDRIFEILYTTENNTLISTGKYKGKKPKQAAFKAFTQLCKKINNNCENELTDIKFGMRELTKNSKHKCYWYNGCRVSSHNNTKFEILDGKKIETDSPKNPKNKVFEHKYKNQINKIDKLLCTHIIDMIPKIE